MTDKKKKMLDSDQKEYEAVVNKKKQTLKKGMLFVWKYRCIGIVLYFFTTIGFTNKNTLIDIFHNYVKIQKIENKIQNSETQLNEMNKQINRLKDDPDVLELIARERYLMKRENEDIFQFKEDLKKEDID